MSKIGNFNLEMTEKVNELGYDTVEEAIADGWDSNEFYLSYHEEKRNELDEAHEAWLKERGEVIKGLQATWFYLNNLGEKEDADNVSRAMKFIEEGEM